jgi:hypothetical protein
VFDFLALSSTVPAASRSPALMTAAPNRAILPPPTAVHAKADFVVETMEAMLRVRSAASASPAAAANVLTHLPDGHPVRLVSDQEIRGFREVETSFLGAHVRGFAKAEFLSPAPRGTKIPILALADPPPKSRIDAVLMPRKEGTVIKRTAAAGAHSLNESRQPMREGSTPAELVASISAIIEWLAVDEPSHKRYQAHDGKTFCNIYVHDYCRLAGAYVPRVCGRGSRSTLSRQAARFCQRSAIPSTRCGQTTCSARCETLVRT